MTLFVFSGNVLLLATTLLFVTPELGKGIKIGLCLRNCSSFIVFGGIAPSLCDTVAVTADVEISDGGGFDVCTTGMIFLNLGSFRISFPASDSTSFRPLCSAEFSNVLSVSSSIAIP